MELGSEPKPMRCAKATRILQLASEGKGDKEIARELGLSESGIDYHWRKIRKSLGAADRTQAVCRGLDFVDREQYLSVVRELEHSRRREEALRAENKRVAEQRAQEPPVDSEGSRNPSSQDREPRGGMRRIDALRRHEEAEPVFLFPVGPIPIRILLFDGVEPYGYKAEEFCQGGKTLLDLIHEGDREFLRSHWIPMMNLGGPMIEIQCRTVTARGETRWLYAKAAFEEDSLGIFNSYCGVGFDGTPNVKAGIWSDRAWTRYRGRTYENL